MSAKSTAKSKTLLLQGNEAIAEGAIAAGCRFFAGYPITPASEISEYMARKLPLIDGTYISMEDEIASMGSIIGASLAGAKSMTATSGPGFSLMQENLGFACMTEVPCVVVNVMRMGPSTGLPTFASQGDVMQARWGTHGDHPIIVLAVSSARDCYDLTILAFNLSEKYRVPVIILSDEVVAHTRETITLPATGDIEVAQRPRPTVPPEWYVPYEDNGTGVPAMVAFGEGYRHHVTGLSHDVRGFPTQRTDEMNILMSRLFRKITQGFHEIQRVSTYRMEDAEIAVIAYGSVSRSARRAVDNAREHGVKAGLMQLVTLFPFPRRHVESVLQQCRSVLVPEMNIGQISREVKRVNNTSCRVMKYNRVDGRLITPEEITDCLIRMYY